MKHSSKNFSSNDTIWYNGYIIGDHDSTDIRSKITLKMGNDNDVTLKEEDEENCLKLPKKGDLENQKIKPSNGTS